MKQFIYLLIILLFCTSFCGCDKGNRKDTERHTDSLVVESSSNSEYHKETNKNEDALNKYISTIEDAEVFEDYLMGNMQVLVVSNTSVQKIKIIDGNIVSTEIIPTDSISDIKTNDISFVQVEICANNCTKSISINLSKENYKLVYDLLMS